MQRICFSLALAIAAFILAEVDAFADYRVGVKTRFTRQEGGGRRITYVYSGTPANGVLEVGNILTGGTVVNTGVYYNYASRRTSRSQWLTSIQHAGASSSGQLQLDVIRPGSGSMQLTVSPYLR